MFSRLCSAEGTPMNCMKAQLEEMDRANKKIEKELRAEKKKIENRMKILLLGCGEAGKSTFIKQMKIIHAEKGDKPWTEEQLKQYRKEVLRNVIQCVQILLAEKQKDLPIGFENNARKLEELKADDERDQERLYQHRVFIREIWQHRTIQDAYKRRREFHLPDCCQYFLSDIDRVTNPDFVPTDQDILQIRVMTTGVIEYNFPMKTSGQKKEIMMIDVGGQRSERKKWIHCFEDVLLLMFLVAASEYDQVLMEDHNQNRMEESRTLFKIIISETWFKSTAITLFLNKKDLLADKIQDSPLEQYFPQFLDFKGYKQKNYDAAMAFIKDMFLNMTKEDGTYILDVKTRSIFVHETCATDTDNIRKVFEDVKCTVLERALQTLY